MAETSSNSNDSGLDTKESPTDKFKRLAKDRAQRTKHMFKLLKNLSSGAYKIDQTLAQEIVTEIEEELQSLKYKWKLAVNPNKTRKARTDSSEPKTDSSPEDVLDMLSSKEAELDSGQDTDSDTE